MCTSEQQRRGMQGKAGHPLRPTPWCQDSCLTSLCLSFPFKRVLFPCNSSGMPWRYMQGTFKTSFWATWNIKGFYWSGESPGNRLHWATYWWCVPFTFMKKKVHISIGFVQKHLSLLNHLFQYAWLKPTLIKGRITSHCLNRHVGLVTPSWGLCEKAFYPLAYPKYKPSIYWVFNQQRLHILPVPCSLSEVASS